MTCGIYLGSPKNNSTHKVYIGQSNNIEQRIKRHDALMRAGDSSKILNEAYKDYGDFSWEILQECPEAQLDAQEKYYIKLFNTFLDGFNTYEDAYSTPPSRYGIDNGNVCIEKVPLYELALNITINNPTYSRGKVAELSGLKTYEISSLWYGKSYKWLSDLFPIEYAKVISLNKSRQIGGKTSAQQNIEYPPLLSPSMQEYTVENVRDFARNNSLDQGDLGNVLNMKVASVKGWIVKDLDILNPEQHLKFYSTNRGHYKKQFDMYKQQ